MTTMSPARPAAQAQTAGRHGDIAGRTPDGSGAVAGRDRSADGKLHLTLAVPDLRGGGGERMVLTLAQALLELGHRVDLLITGNARVDYPVPDGARLFLATVGEGTSPDTTPPVPVPIPGGNRSRHGEWLHYPGSGVTLRNRLAIACRVRPDIWPTLYRFLRDRSSMRTVLSIARYLEAVGPDCVLASLPHAKVNCLLARCVIPDPPPVVPIMHSLMQFREKMHRRMYPRLLPTAPRVVAVSHAVADSVRFMAPRAAPRVVTIHNPVQLDHVVARADDPPPHPWLDDDAAPVILATGGLREVKNFALLLCAFARVARARPCRLLILGEGPQRPRLEAMLRELRLTGNVALPGWMENPWAAMARAAMFALSSHWEGLPTVLIEALACGCPVVSTDAGGAREILDGGRYGALVPPGDEVRLALAIARTLGEEASSDLEQRRQRREERKLRAQRFRPERAVEQYLNLVTEIASGKDITRDGTP